MYRYIYDDVGLVDIFPDKNIMQEVMDKLLEYFHDNLLGEFLCKDSRDILKKFVDDLLIEYGVDDVIVEIRETDDKDGMLLVLKRKRKSALPKFVRYKKGN